MSFSAKIFEKIVKFDTQTLDKAEIVKINGEKISALPPETRKWLKISLPDNRVQKYLRKMENRSKTCSFSCRIKC